MKILVILITLLKLTRFIKGQVTAENPFKPSFAFRSFINDTSLTFGINDQVTSVSDLFRNSQPSRRSRSDLPKFLQRNNQVNSRTSTLQRNLNPRHKQNQRVRTRPNIPTFPQRSTGPKSSESPKLAIQAVPGIPDFPTAVGVTKSTSRKDTSLKDKRKVNPNNVLIDFSSRMTNGRVRTGPRTSKPLIRQRTDAVIRKNNALQRNKNVDTGSPKSARKSLRNVPENTNKLPTSVNNAKRPGRTKSAAEDISSIETVKEGLNVANTLANTISEDAIRKKFIDFFIRNSKKPKKLPKEQTEKNVAALQNKFERANPLPPISPTESRFNMGPFSQITNLMSGLSSNTSEPDAPMTFFIGPLLVPAHVIESAKEDQSGRTIDRPLIALPFGPGSHGRTRAAPRTASQAQRNARRQPPKPTGHDRKKDLPKPLVVQPNNIPVARIPTTEALLQPPNLEKISAFRRSNSDIQKILDASLAAGSQRRVVNPRTSRTQTSRSSQRDRPDLNVRNDQISRRTDSEKRVRTRARRPSRNFSRIPKGVIINRNLVPIDVARQAVQTMRRRNRLSRQPLARLRTPTSVDSSRSVSLQRQQELLNRNSLNFFQNIDLQRGRSARVSELRPSTPPPSQPTTPTSPSFNFNNVFSPLPGNQNNIPSDLSQFFIDPTQLSANEIADLSQQNTQNNFGTQPVQAQQNPTNVFAPTITTQTAFHPSLRTQQFNIPFQDFQRPQMVVQPFQNNLFSRVPVQSNSPFQSLQTNFNAFQRRQPITFPAWV